MKLFRRIRQKFLLERKVQNYLLYAVGEILLVVIGILIALAINNYNEASILQKKEQTYLIGLRNEFETSKLKLQELIKVNRQSYEGAKQILEYISNPDALPDEQVLSELLYRTFAFDVSFNPNNSLLNEMINSGSLKDLRNTELRKQLTNWISTLEDISKQEDDLGRQREEVLDLIRSDEYSLRTILDQTGVLTDEVGLSASGRNTSNLKLLRSAKFENNVLMFILSSLATETSHYTPLMEHLDLILQMIEAEIKG
jgi:hypothetical protein